MKVGDSDRETRGKCRARILCRFMILDSFLAKPCGRSEGNVIRGVPSNSSGGKIADRTVVWCLGNIQLV